MRISEIIQSVRKTTLVFCAICMTSSALANEGTKSYAEHYFPELSGILEQVPRSSLLALIADAQIEEMQGEYIVGKSQLYPHIYGEYNLIYGLQTKKDKDRTAQFLPVGDIKFIQPIYYWGGLIAQKQISQIRLCMSQRRHEQALSLLKQELRETYLNIFHQDNCLKITRSSLKRLEDDLSSARSRHSSGQISAAELAEKKVAYREAALNSREAEKQLDFTIKSFRHIAQYEGPLFENPPETRGIISSFSEKPDLHNQDTGEAFATYFIENEICIEKLNYKKIQASQLPQFDFQAGFTYEMTRGTNANNSVAQFDIFAGAKIQWDIFSGYSTKGEKIISKAKQRKLLLELKLEKNRIDLENFKAERELMFLEEKIKINEERYAMQEKSVASHETRLAQGQVSRTQYLKAKTKRDQTESEILGQIFEYINLSDKQYFSKLHN